MRISVLGAGGWGTTLAILLHNNGHNVDIWEYKKSYAKTMHKARENKLYLPGVFIPKEINITYDLEEACLNKHMIVIAVPTQ
ncbi:MAG: glycerol-3-phosphate dehydrogenase, partial [Melioribacteraceae bacterium]